MSGCIVAACAETCAVPCPVADLTKRIEELEKTVKPPDLVDLPAYIIANAGNIILLAAGMLAIGLVIRWMCKGGFDKLILKSAELSPTGASFAFEAAATQVDAMLDQVQDFVVDSAANAEEIAAIRALWGKGVSFKSLTDVLGKELDRFSAAAPPVTKSTAETAQKPAGQPGKPFLQMAFSDKLPRKRYDPLHILWSLPEAEARPFERRVIKAMGNQIDVVIGAKAAQTRLAGGAVYDLVITDATVPETDEPGGLDLARNLIVGIHNSWHDTAALAAQVGPATRLAVLAPPETVERVAAELADFIVKRRANADKDVIPHYLVTADFGDLRRSVRWAQKAKTPVKKD